MCGWYRYWNNIIYRPGTKVGFGECRVRVCVCCVVCYTRPCVRVRLRKMSAGAKADPIVDIGSAGAVVVGGSEREHLTMDFLYTCRLWHNNIIIQFRRRWRYRKVPIAFRYQLLIYFILASHFHGSHIITIYIIHYCSYYCARARRETFSFSSKRRNNIVK